MSEQFSKHINWADDNITEQEVPVSSKAKPRQNNFKHKKITNPAKKHKTDAETLPTSGENDNAIHMTEFTINASNIDFVHQYFFDWIQRVHDYEFFPPNNVALTKVLASFLFTNEQFKLLEYTRETAFSSWVRETYEHWSGQFQAKEVLTANEVDRYCIYASLLRLEILNELKRTLINVQTNLVLILELEAKFTPECKQRLEEWYTELSEAQMLSFMQFYTTSIPELPDVYHERATFEWPDLASAHCCLGDTMFDESQDAEPSCSIKPLAQTDPSHATSIAISILIFCVLLCSNWTWTPRDQCRYDSFPCRANQLSTKDGGFLNLIQHLKTLLLWKLIRRRSTLGADFTRLDCVVVDSLAFNFEQPIVKRIRIRYVVVVVDLFRIISCMQCCIPHRWCPPSGSPSADRHDIHLFDS